MSGTWSMWGFMPKLESDHVPNMHSIGYLMLRTNLELTWEPAYRFSGIWRGIMSIKESVNANIKIHLGEGRKLLFKKDNWAGDSSLAVQFPNLFTCANDQSANAYDYMMMEGNNILWGPIFRRDLNEREESDLLSLLGILNNFSILGEGMDERVWIPSMDGNFSVASFFLVLAGEERSKDYLDHI